MNVSIQTGENVARLGVIVGRTVRWFYVRIEGQKRPVAFDANTGLERGAYNHGAAARPWHMSTGTLARARAFKPAAEVATDAV